MKNNKFIAALVFSLVLTNIVYSQSAGADTISGIRHAQDLYKIQAAYSQLEYTSFKVKYHYKKNDKPADILDSSSGDYLMHRGMMKASISNSELISNSRYYLMISPDDSMISVSRAVTGAGMFQLNVFDSLFRRANIRGFEKKVQNDSTYVLRILFKPSAYYQDYEITYNNRFLIKKVRIEYPDDEYGDDGKPVNANRKNTLDVHYSNYRREIFDIGIFSEDSYVRKDENGKFVGVGKHGRFEVVAND